MDPFTQAYYRLLLQNRFIRLRGTAFQDLFGDIMSRCHPTDYIRSRPWGSSGDRKNDGYLRSERTLFQVYAPNEMKAREATEKIATDFSTALPYWRDYFDTWSFVHNALDGLGPEILTVLLNLERQNPELRFTQMGYEAIEGKVFSLESKDLEALFGYAPDARSLNSVRAADLIYVLEQLAQADVLADVEIRPISIEKINRNSLSEESKVYLRNGQRKSGLVAGIVASFADALRGEEIVQGFRNRYLDLRTQALSPDRILSELIQYAGGYSSSTRGLIETQRHEAAVASVLAYLFERCDIFEDPLPSAST